MTSLDFARISTRHARTVLVSIGVAAVFVLSGCGDGDSSADDSTTTTTDATTSSTADSTTTTGDDSTTTSSSTSTTEPTTTTLPGDPVESFFEEGDTLGVLGVAHDDVLNIREAPGTDQDIVATADPLADDLVATGQARALSSTTWAEVTVGGETGWANLNFLAFIGGVDDATAEFLDGAPLPETETMVELGELVAEGFASEDPPSEIVRSVAPSVGDLGEVTYDVVGIGDDSVRGYRLHIFGTPADSGEGFGLKSIERTTFCSRGLDGELCT